jgi:hypothetical protein
MMAMDSSPPTSPPRAPMPREVGLTTIPDGIADGNLDRVRHPRSPDHNEHCRAWWDHDADSHWRANVVTRVEATEDEDPVIITGPNDVFPQIASSGLEIYRNRLRDHYGRIASGEGLQWPAFGIRVPYAPLTTLDDIDWRKEHSEVGLDQFPGVVSMAVPLIAASQRGWWDPKEPAGGFPPVDSESDSEPDDDDGGGAFAESYRECSGAGAGGVPPAPMPAGVD